MQSVTVAVNSVTHMVDFFVFSRYCFYYMANLYKAELLHAVFTMCGIPDPAIRAYALIIIKKHPQDGRTDIMEMATKMRVSHPGGRRGRCEYLELSLSSGFVLLGTVVIKQLCNGD
jgi:hypothetical protein